MVDTSRASDVAEVLIIGAGASGAVAAKHLAEAGVGVVCLEQGPIVDVGEYSGDKPEWELLAQKRWHANPNVRCLESDYPINTSQTDVDPVMYNAVGGSTILYSAHWHRFTPSDFRVKTQDGVADDWPFAYEDLEPFYDIMDVEMGVSGLAGDPAHPPMTPPPLPPLPIGRTGLKAAEGMHKLGWHWWPGYQAIPSRPYRRLSQCARRGTCKQGCPEQAKGSFDITHWPDAIAHGAKLITGARVREITVDARGRVSGAIYVDRAGVEHRQKAERVIVCANGIGTPRLLLLSASGRYPDGLANSSGLVGKNLMHHPNATVVGCFDEPLDGWMGPFGEAINSKQFYETDTSRGFVRGGKWNVCPTGGPMRAYPKDDQWGAELHRNTRRYMGRSFEWAVSAEDLPLESNRVVLDPELTDSDGVPAPKIRYRVQENTVRILDFNVARMEEAMAASGATEMISNKLVRECGWHLLGTCRMGSNPDCSVVDQWGQSHDVPNLYILDGSVFVTCGSVNPTATICAVALRCVLNMIEVGGERERAT
ncbi:MAG: GMC family oxidoreductase [Hyphomicrobiales bacterium]|nr:GMC family oxidoreductase [Hyphomicrobiales bacterium]